MILNDLLFGGNYIIDRFTDFQIRIFKDENNYEKISNMGFNIYNFDENDDFIYLSSVSCLEVCSLDFYNDIKKYLNYKIFDIHASNMNEKSFLNITLKVENKNKRGN